MTKLYGRLIVKLTVVFTGAVQESDHNNRRGSLPKSVGHLF